MTESEIIGLFKCLADATRLQILKSLAEGPLYVELLAQRLDRTPSTVSFHLKKLEEAGLVTAKKEQYYTVYALCPSLLETRLEELVCARSAQAQEQALREQRYRDQVLESFFEYGKLKALPVQRKKKRIVLEEMVSRFETGRTYTEKEVNLIIAEMFDDFCTVRRDFIAEGLMQRDHQLYQRVENGVAEPELDKS